MEELTKLSVAEFLERVGDRQPSPGGGSVAGAVGALACSLGCMVVAYSIGPKTKADVRERMETSLLTLRRLKQIMSALITQDAEAYETMQSASKDRSMPDTYQEAALAAVAVPLEIAAVASRALTALDELKAGANRHLYSDLGIAAVLADATARSAWFLVHINARELTDETRRRTVLTEITDTMRHCKARCASIEAFVRERVEDQGSPGR